MKVKSDFITNSSSTCYMVIIPKDLEMTREDYISRSEDYDPDFSEDFEILKEQYEEAKKALTTLKSGNPVYRGDVDFEFWALQQWLEDKDLIIQFEPAAGGDGEDIISPIDLRKLREILKTHPILKQQLATEKSVGILQNE